jgi:hypothetical protein
MTEQEIEQLAYLLKKAQSTLTHSSKGCPDYITVNSGVLVGTSVEIYNGVISDYKLEKNNEVVVNHFSCY